jgi:hypothetical protein
LRNRYLKRKEARGCVGGLFLFVRDGPAGRGPEERNEATAKKKMNEAVASASSESGNGALEKEGDSLFKEGEMLKLREEYWEAALLWEKLVPGVLDRWLLVGKQDHTYVPAKKKKKVVRIIMANAYIDDIIENPDMMRELSDEEMAKCLE